MMNYWCRITFSFWKNALEISTIDSCGILLDRTPQNCSIEANKIIWEGSQVKQIKLKKK